MTVRNATGGTLAVGFKAEADATELDEALRVRVSRPRTSRSAKATLAELRAGTRESRSSSRATRRPRCDSLRLDPDHGGRADWQARSDQLRI